MAKKKNPCGLLIQLEKNALGQHQNGNNYIMGYYDRLTIKPVSNWLSYSPRNSAPSISKCRVIPAHGDDSISSYPIKLIFPAKHIREKLGKTGLYYESWQTNQLDYSQNQPTRGLFDDFPCISIILVNLTDAFKGEFPRDYCDELLIQLSEVISSCELSPSKLENAHCCILPSIGYSDYCILLAEKDWDVSLELMRCLHSAIWKDSTGKEVPVLSTDYLMPAYHVACAKSVKINSSVQLAVHANLQPGVSMEYLARVVGKAADVYQASGSSDCLLVSKTGQGAGKLIRMLMPKQKSGDPAIANLVVNTESVLQNPIPSISNKRLDLSENLSEEKRALREMESALAEYGELIETNNRHMRQLSALYECMTSIKNFFEEKHNKSLRRIMTSWISALTDCLNICIADIKNDRKKPWEYVETALENFISQVGSFLADLSRSDCFFMEIERYNHPSVSSATMLLIAYNQWLNAFARDIMDTAGIGNAHYNFLVRSGGCDRTETTNIFHFLSPSIENGFVNENLPLISQMSEMSLFDCSGSVFRMTHECMHFCGNRKRAERISYIFSFLSRYYATILATVLFQQDAYQGLVQDYMREGLYVTDTKKYQAIEEIYLECWKSLCMDIAEEIDSELKEAFEREKDSWLEPNYMTAELQSWLIGKLSSMFSCYEDYADMMARTFNPFTNKLYISQLETVKTFYKKCDQLFEPGDRFLTVDLQMVCWYHNEFTRKMNGKESSGSSPYADQNLERWIPRILSQFLMTPDGSDIEAACGADKTYESLNELRKNNVSTIVANVVLTCFSEAFADIEACVRLDIDLTDYILAFTYENWDLDEHLDIYSDLQLFRIPVILNLCFGNCLTPDLKGLTMNAQITLGDALNNLKQHGLPKNRINTASLIKRIQTFLQIYEDNVDRHWIAEPLVKYLEMCRDSYLASDEQCAKMRKYQCAFQKIRVWALTDDEDSEVNMFRALAMIGREQGGIENGCTM